MPFPPAVAAPIVSCFLCGWPWLQKKIAYARKLHRKIEILRGQSDALSQRKADAIDEIKKDEVCKVPTNECQGWIQRVEEIEAKLAGILEEYRNRPRCCLNICPIFCSRVQLGRRVGKLIEDVERENKFTGAIVKDSAPTVADEFPVVRVDDNTVPAIITKELIQYLEGDGINIISIWGAGGIGKTTILKRLNNNPSVAQMFGVVIWATAPKDANLRLLRKRIGEKLYKDDWDDTISEEEAITRLCRKLSAKKFLLLIDDIGRAVDLEQLGIPVLDGTNGKIVITTRDLRICKRMMTNKNIKVPYLPEKEAWDLFVKRTGDVVNQNLEIQQVAKDIVKECGGLPLAICAVGGSLRNESNKHVWQNSLRELNSPGSFEVTPDMDENLFKLLQFSYDRLQGHLKKCFLYAALYPEGFEIFKTDLIEFWIAEEFIDTRAGTSTEIRHAAHTILQVLMEASLVENEDKYHVKLHDIIRDLALRIVSAAGENTNNFLVRAGAQIGEFPGKQDWEQATKISFTQNQGLVTIPETPSCSKLTTLLLEKSSLSSIPHPFFEKTVLLKVLDLSETLIEFLPSSISQSKNLEALYLTGCTNLEPPFTWLKGLVKLRRLQISSFQQDELGTRPFPPGLLSSLTAMEELSIYPSNFNRDDSWSENVYEIVDEIAGLEHLDSLRFHFPRTEQLQQFIRKSRPWIERRLRLFELIIGFHRFHYRYSISTYGKMRKHCFEMYDKTCILLSDNGCINRTLQEAITEVVSRAEFCALDDIHGLRTIVPGLGMEDCWNQMKVLNIEECPELEFFMSESSCIEFSKLERLTLVGLPDLRSIVEPSLPPGCLSLLKHLKLQNCNSLSKLFSIGDAILPSLKTLSITVSLQMVEVFGITMPLESPFPALKSITLDTLPMLTRFGVDFSVVTFPSLEEMSLILCPLLESLHLEINKMPKMRKLICNREWWETLQWQSEEDKLQFETMCDFCG